MILMDWIIYAHLNAYTLFISNDGFLSALSKYADDSLALPILPPEKASAKPENVNYSLFNQKITFDFQTKAASTSTTKRIIVHPERQKLSEEKTKKLAELFRIVKGE